MNEKDIQDKLKNNFSTHKYILTNSFVFPWESDFFSMSKSGFFYEVEVKVSVADFKKDFEKTMKHRCLENSDKEYVARVSPETIQRTFKRKEGGGRIRIEIPQGYCHLSYMKVVAPNRFFYAVPEELIDSVIELVPDYAGLLSVNRHVKQVKNAPLLHNKKMYDDLSGILLSKFYWLSVRQEHEINDLKGKFRVI